MTHLRYWAMMLALGVGGAFITIERFAFAPSSAVWIAFGVAIAAAALALGAFLVALLRSDHAFSGLSALAALVSAWIIIDTRVFATPAALWIAFAGGLVLLLLALRALALHETTVERVVHALQPASEADRPAPAGRLTAVSTRHRKLGPVKVSATMRSWMYWLAHIGLAVAGAFVVLISFALSTPGHHHASVRWLAFGIGIAAACVALAALLERGLLGGAAGAGDRARGERLLAIAISGASAAVAIAMIVTMIAIGGQSARWVAFALGCGLAGSSLLALIAHELTSERVRHELEIAQPAPAPQPQTASTTPAA